MVTVDEIRAAACRHDTVMAWAFRRALGIRDRPVRRKAGGSGRMAEGLRYRGLDECFANRGRAPWER